MEDYPVKFDLIQDNSRLDWQKLGEPRNWEKLGVHIGNVRVEKTSKSVIVHSGQLSGFNEYAFLQEAGSIQALVKAILEDKGVILGNYGVPLHQDPIFKFYNRAADVFNQVYGTIETEDGSIDHSPPDDIPHIEFKGPRTAANFISMGNRVATIEKRLEARDKVLEANVKALEAILGLAKLVETTTEVLKQSNMTIEQVGNILKDLTAPRTQDANRKDPMLV